MRLRAAAVVLLAGVVGASCGAGAPPLEPTSPAPARSAGATGATAAGNAATAHGEGFYILAVQCEPKGNKTKRDHFEVTPVTGNSPPLQLRCKGQGDLHGPGPWLVRPKSDTDQSYVCTPSPVTLKEDKKKNRVVCRKG
jgi:hypothetical protein